MRYNQIDKFDFLDNYQHMQLEAFQPNTIWNSFMATGLILINVERVLSKLKIFLECHHHWIAS